MNAAVADATDNILTFRSQEIPLRQLSIGFYLKYYDCLTVKLLPEPWPPTTSTTLNSLFYQRRSYNIALSMIAAAMGSFSCHFLMPVLMHLPALHVSIYAT
jgi:hypothetical protein